jgi:hypothetical protein
LAILDLHLPGEQKLLSEDVGFELLRELKAARPLSRIAIRSGYETHQNLAKAIDGGVDAFIGKDWKPADVLANIHFLHVWTTAGAALRELSAGLDVRDPDTAGHGCPPPLGHRSTSHPGTWNSPFVTPQSPHDYRSAPQLSTSWP